MQESIVFIVRLWAVEPQPAFRAAVLRAGSDESTWFTQADALTSYFEQQLSAPEGAPNRIERKEHP